MRDLGFDVQTLTRFENTVAPTSKDDALFSSIGLCPVYWFMLAANNTPSDETQIVQGLGTTVAKNYQSLVIYQAAAGCNFTDVESALHHLDFFEYYSASLGNIFTALQNTADGVDGYIADMRYLCDFSFYDDDGDGDDIVYGEIFNDEL